MGMVLRLRIVIEAKHGVGDITSVFPYLSPPVDDASRPIQLNQVDSGEEMDKQVPGASTVFAVVHLNNRVVRMVVWRTANETINQLKVKHRRNQYCATASYDRSGLDHVELADDTASISSRALY